MSAEVKVTGQNQEQFLLLAKSAKGAALATLIHQVLEAPGVYVFGELLDMPNVRELAESDFASTFRLLTVFAYGTYADYLAEARNLPPLNSGNIDVPPNMASWASFHNGVAAGLKIAPASQIDSAWIVYNKPKHAELANEYAGFLMALGLNGHLTKLATLNIHDYLTKGHEMTSIGLLLGVSAAKLGTMDMSITRLLSIHVPALLPPTSTELDVPHNVQVAAVVGIGLVYQGTAHRHTAEVLLAEIGRPPGPEMEYCTDRESYSLAAGLALGMVCLGVSSLSPGFTQDIFELNGTALV